MGRQEFEKAQEIDEKISKLETIVGVCNKGDVCLRSSKGYWYQIDDDIKNVIAQEARRKIKILEDEFLKL